MSATHEVVVNAVCPNPSQTRSLESGSESLSSWLHCKGVWASMSLPTTSSGGRSVRFGGGTGVAGSGHAVLFMKAKATAKGPSRGENGRTRSITAARLVGRRPILPVEAVHELEDLVRVFGVGAIRPTAHDRVREHEQLGRIPRRPILGDRILRELGRALVVADPCEDDLIEVMSHLFVSRISISPLLIRPGPARQGWVVR